MGISHDAAPACTTGRGPRSVLVRDVGALFRRHGQAYRRTHALGLTERRALRDISACRTGALGGHRDVCGRCGHERSVYNSCRNRHCPKCQALRQARWVAARMQRALPVRHFHVVFTLPAELRPLVRAHETLLLDLLFAAASETIIQLGLDPKRLGALVGVTGVVHTWGRNLSFHPHLHCIVTGGGLGSDGVWVDSPERYLLPVKVLAKLFRGKFLDGLARLFADGKLAQGPCARQIVAALADAAAFARLKDTLYKKDWVVYAKAPFRNPGALFRYLGLYTHRVAISNSRLLHVDDAEIVFRTRDKQVCRLAPLEFMQRFLQHVLPRGFVKIRHFGLLAAGNVNTTLVAARADIEQRDTDRERRRNVVDSAVAIPPSPSPVTAPMNWRDLFQQLTGIDLGLCPDCGDPLTPEPLSDEPVPSARAPPS
jgi:Putative transposase/Transposase zinc-binding domain